MDVRYINPFLKAVDLVFTTMAHTAVSMGRPYLKDVDSGSTLYCANAVIRLAGSTSGVVCVRVTKPVMMGLVKALTGETPKSIDADCRDALGEIANMIVGNAKQGFPGGEHAISTPNVVESDPLEQPPVLVLPFDCGYGRFLVESKLRSTPPSAVAAA